MLTLVHFMKMKSFEIKTVGRTDFFVIDCICMDIYFHFVVIKDLFEHR